MLSLVGFLHPVPNCQHLDGVARRNRLISGHASWAQGVLQGYSIDLPERIVAYIRAMFEVVYLPLKLFR